MFQKEEPMIHMLYPQMQQLVQDLLVKFVNNKVMKNLTDINELVQYNVNNTDDYSVQPDMGTKTMSLLTTIVKDKLAQKKFVEVITSFYVASTGYLLANLPLGKAVIRDAQYLHPNLKRKKIEKPLLRLVGEVATCLGDSFHAYFDVDKSCTVDDLKDMIKTEVSFYRMETIPESFYTLSKMQQKKKRRQRRHLRVREHTGNKRMNVGFPSTNLCWQSTAPLLMTRSFEECSAIPSSLH